MRLIDTDTLELQEFPSAPARQYAILSHTWGEGEVTFGDMSSPAAARGAKRGWAKIRKTCQLAKAAGLRYAWVDTCCIDKSSSAELSESINSMFQWYGAAHVCYAYIEDLGPGVSIEQGLPACRWITRGWTLQELLAPWEVRFFDGAWGERGSKADLESVIEGCTHIPAKVLRGERPLSSLSIATRMSWAASRRTTRVEDVAYSIMGLFDVQMPLLYGEGMYAFRRLQEEIMRHTQDLSILCWNDEACRARPFHPLLASHPAAFSGMANVYQSGKVEGSYTVTNNRVQLTSLVHFFEPPDGGRQLYVIPGGQVTPTEQGGTFYVRLRKLDANTFCRVGELLFLHKVNLNLFVNSVLLRNYCLVIDEPSKQSMDQLRFLVRRHAAHIPSTTRLKSVSPKYFWDVGDRIFLRANADYDRALLAVYAAKVLIPVRAESVELVVLLRRWSNRDKPWTCRIFEPKMFPRETRWIFSPRWEMQECLYWPDLDFHAPRLVETTTSMTTVRVGTSQVSIVASLKLEDGTVISEPVPVYVLHLEESDGGGALEGLAA